MITLPTLTFGDAAISAVNDTGALWFALQDVCRVLSIVDYKDAGKGLYRHEKQVIRGESRSKRFGVALS